MIVETRPLHKKKKRLAKQRSLREMQGSPSVELVSYQQSNKCDDSSVFNKMCYFILMPFATCVLHIAPVELYFAACL